MSKGIIDEGESQENRLAKDKVKMILYASGNISERKFKRSLDNNIVTSVRSTDDDIDISVDNNPPETTAKQRRATSRKSEHRTERTERTERRSSEKEKHTQKNQKLKLKFLICCCLPRGHCYNTVLLNMCFIFLIQTKASLPK